MCSAGRNLDAILNDITESIRTGDYHYYDDNETYDYFNDLIDEAINQTLHTVFIFIVKDGNMYKQQLINLVKEMIDIAADIKFNLKVNDFSNMLARIERWRLLSNKLESVLNNELKYNSTGDTNAK